MSDSDKDIPVLLNELDRLATGTSERLTAAVEDVDKIIELLTQARAQIAQGLSASPTTSVLPAPPLTCSRKQRLIHIQQASH